MLNQVLHDKKSGASVCHPESRPELVSGLFGISVLVSEILGLEAHHAGEILYF
jgi:hypothetical protein